MGLGKQSCEEQPRLPLASKLLLLVLRCLGPRFVLGGITLSHADEEPFSREAAREVILTLPPAEFGRRVPLSDGRRLAGIPLAPEWCARRAPAPHRNYDRARSRRVPDSSLVPTASRS